MHRVSDNLQHRHPYNDPPFRESANPKEVARAFGSGALQKYARLLEMDDLPDEDRCRALQEFRETLSNQETKYTAVSKELVLLCANLTDVPSASVRSNAALTMAALVLCEPDANDELGNEIMLSAATKLLGDEEEEVVISGCTVFRNLTISNEGALLVAGKAEIVSKLTAMLTEPPLRLIPIPVLELLVEVLANLTRVYEGARSVAHSPIFPPLLAVLKKPLLYRTETILHGALIVSNAATHNHGKQDAIRDGAVEMCLRVLTKSLNGAFTSASARLVDELTRSLVSAVMGLSTVEEAKPQVIEFGVEPLSRCLQHPNVAVKKNAAIAINSACEAPGGTVHFAQRLINEPELIVEVLGVKAIPALTKSAASVDDDEKLAALTAILALNRAHPDGAAAEQVLQTLGLLSALVECTLLPNSTDDDDKTRRRQQQLAAEILQAMCAASDAHCRRIGKLLKKHGANDASFSVVTGLSPADFTERYA